MYIIYPNVIDERYNHARFASGKPLRLISQYLQHNITY